MELLSPWALFGLATLTIPLIIHLLRSRTAPIVKIGSIKFLRETESITSRRWQPSEWLLLTLRLLLLSALVLLMADPVWYPSSHAKRSQSWALISPELYYHTTDKTFFLLLDSLRASGVELRWLAADFPPFKEYDSVALASESIWSLLQEADAALPLSSSLWILTSDRLLQFYGTRPTLRRRVQWHTFTLSEQKTWVQSARLIGHDSVWVITGESTPHYTRFQAALQSAAAATMRHTTVMPPMAPQVVAILYEDSRQRDAEYLELAIKAASEGLKRTVKVVRTRSLPLLSTASLIFWLSSAPVPDSLFSSLRGKTKIFFDARTQGKAVQQSFLTSTGERIALWRRTPASPSNLALWYDDFGEPILEASKVGPNQQYAFHSRFSPEWSDFVLSPAFPEWLMSLLEEPASITAENDLRRITHLQCLPQHDSLHRVPFLTPPHTARQSLTLPIWIFAVILFIIERLFSQRKSHVI